MSTDYGWRRGRRAVPSGAFLTPKRIPYGAGNIVSNELRTIVVHVNPSKRRTERFERSCDHFNMRVKEVQWTEVDGVRYPCAYELTGHVNDCARIVEHESVARNADGEPDAHFALDIRINPVSYGSGELGEAAARRMRQPREGYTPKVGVMVQETAEERALLVSIADQLGIPQAKLSQLRRLVELQKAAPCETTTDMREEGERLAAELGIA